MHEAPLECACAPYTQLLAEGEVAEKLNAGIIYKVKDHMTQGTEQWRSHDTWELANALTGTGKQVVKHANCNSHLALRL